MTAFSVYHNPLSSGEYMSPVLDSADSREVREGSSLRLAPFHRKDKEGCTSNQQRFHSKHVKME